MSLINQMLQDLEKRRASGGERGALPNQVRVLPPPDKTTLSWRAAGITGTVALIAFVGWRLSNNYPISPSSPIAQTPALSSAPAQAQSPRSGPTSRLSLELASVPVARTIASAAAGAGSQVDEPAQAGPPRRKPGAMEFQSHASATPPAPLATAAVIAPSVSTPAKSAPTAVNPEPVKIAALPTDTPTPAAVSIKPAGSAPRMVDVLPEKPGQEVTAKPQIDKRAQTLTAQQLAENEYRDAANLLELGRLADAQEGFRRALQLNPAHDGARQGLYGLLAAAKKYGEAEQVLQDGLKLNSNQLVFAMALSGLQYERGDIAGAVETLQKSAPAAHSSPDYLARLAALLQRQSRHPEAVERYQAALRLAPGSGVWLMGLGISLQAVGRNKDAQDIFRRAKASNTLNPELQAFVDLRLKQLQ